MGRGQRPAARSAGKRGASKSTSQSKPATESPDEWMYHVDTQQPLNTDVLLKLFNLGAACTKTYGAHKGKDCTQSSACLVGIYTRPNIKALAEASVGTPPSTATVKDVKLAAGLKNLANTCYLNAVIQCLSHIEPLMRATLSADTLADYDVPATFARLLATRFTAVDPQPMVDALKIDKTVQQDAQEFLSLFLALLSDRSQSVSDVIKRDLTGAMLYSRVCGNCNGVSKKTDTYIFLSVPVVKDSTIAACIAASRAPESVVASCDKCHATNVTFTSSVALKSLPRYLFIHFLRFQYDAVTMRRKKVADAVQFEPFVSASAVSGDESDSRTYRLRAVVNHLGASPDNGHYVAHVVDHLGNWHLYDDDEVKESTQFKGFDAGKPLSSKDVYMALYELLDAHESGDGLLSAIPSPLLDQIRRDEDERERMASDFEMLKADRIKDFTEWETLCEKVFPTNNAALTATRAAEDSEVLTSYFVSSRWLSRLASGAVVTAEGLEKKVSNRDILCRHGRAVYPSASFRVVSPSSWNLLAGVYGSDMALPLLDSMCSECSKEYLQRRQASKDAFDAWACLKSRLDQDPPTWKLGDDVAEDPDDEPVYIAASSLDIVRDQREPPSDAQTDIIDLTAPLLCTHNGLSPDVARRVVTSGCVMALMDYGYRSIRALPCKLVDVCQECTRQNVAAAATTHSVKTFKFRCKRDLQAIAPHDSNRAIFNRDLVKYTKNHAKQWQDKCAKEAQDRDAAAKKEADARAAAEAADKKRVSQQMAVNFVPARGQSKAISVDSNTSPAGSTGVRTPTDSRATSMSASPAVDPSGSPSTEFPGTPSECPPRRVEHFIVPSSWVDRFNHWLEDHSHTAVEVPPKGITCAEFECEHGLSRVGVNDLHPTKRKGGPIGIVLKEETVDLLCSSFDVDKSKLFRLVELNEARLIQPRECTTCVEARRAREDLQWRCFENGTLHLEGKVRKSKKHRVTISSKLTPVAYNMTVAALNAMVCTVLNSEYEIYVSGDYVKLIHNKTVMSDMDSTLESHGIQDGDTVVMEIDEDQWLNADSGWQAIPDSVANEGRHTATFAGSALSGAGVDSGTSSSRVKECPMCTYHNAPHRTVCEMCESLLSA